MPPLGAYAFVAVVAALGTYLIMFPVGRLANRYGLVAEPDERHVHAKVTPYGGGIAMFLAFLIAMMVASLLTPMAALFDSSEPIGLVLGGAWPLRLVSSMTPETCRLPPRFRGRCSRPWCSCSWASPCSSSRSHWSVFLVLSPAVTPLLTAVWVIVITNAVNLIDGLDGLAAGVVAIASGALAMYGLRSSSTSASFRRTTWVRSSP